MTSSLDTDGFHNFGSMKATTGTWTPSATTSTTTLIDTALVVCKHIVLTYTHTTVSPSVVPMVNTTLPARGNVIQITFNTNFAGRWIAFGD